MGPIVYLTICVVVVMVVFAMVIYLLKWKEKYDLGQDVYDEFQDYTFEDEQRDFLDARDNVTDFFDRE